MSNSESKPSSRRQALAQGFIEGTLLAYLIVGFFLLGWWLA